MNTLEDRLRTAMRAAGETVAPNSAPPLRLPPPRRWPVAPRPGRPAWHGWLAPIAAAALVACVLALLQVASMVVTGGADKGNSAASAHGIPPYYVVLSYRNSDLGGPPGSALVRATATGKLLTVLKAPHFGRFTAVTAAADQHTFVLAARVQEPPKPKQWPAEANALRFFRLGVGEKAPGARLSELPVKVSPAAFLTSLALSPDGTRLALSLTMGFTSQIRVVSLVTGRSRTWSGTSPGRRANPYGPWIKDLSWAGDNLTLAYKDVSNIRILDTAAPGSGLKLDSVARLFQGDQGTRIAESCPRSSKALNAYIGNAVLSADGHLLIATSGYQRATPGLPAIASIPPELWRGGRLTYPCTAPAWRSVVTRHLRFIRYGGRIGDARWIYWVSPTADSMIVDAYFGFGGRGIVGILRGGTFTPLPGTSQIPFAEAANGVPAAW